MATTYRENGKKKTTMNLVKPCPSGFKRVNGKCVQAGVGPDYKP